MRDEFGLDRWWRLILIWSIGAVTTWVIATLSLNRLPPAGSPHSPPKSAQEALSNWDGKHYAAVAANGYQAKGDAARLVNFFPLYPALARAFGGSKHSLLAGILLSQLLVLCSIMLMSHLAHGKQRESLLVEPGLWLLVNPFGFYMFAAYAESLFLFLTLVHVTAYSMRRASASAFAGLLAGLTRPVAIILPALVGVDAIQRWKRGERTWKPFLVAATPLFGFLLFTLVYVGWIFGDAGAYWNIVATYWTQTPVFPFTTFIADLQSWLTTAADGRIPPPDMILRTFSTVIVIGVLIWQRNKLPIGWVVYCALALLLIHSRNPSQGSGTGRYEAALFPVYFAVARSALPRSRFVWPVLVILALLSMAALNQFATWRWIS